MMIMTIGSTACQMSRQAKRVKDGCRPMLIMISLQVQMSSCPAFGARKGPKDDNISMASGYGLQCSVFQTNQ
jgi:hypothetical protein